MKRADIKRMFSETHPDHEMSTEKTEKMFKSSDSGRIERIKKAGLKRIVQYSEQNGKEFIDADIVKPKRRRIIIPAAAAALLFVSAVAVPALMNSDHAADPLNENTAVSENAVTVNTEETEINISEEMRNTGYEIEEVKTFDEYNEISRVLLASGKVFVYNIDIKDRKKACMLYWRDPETNEEKYTEFLTESDIHEKYKTVNGECPGAQLKDFYISDDGYLYYLGYIRNWNEDRKDGIAGKYNLDTGKNETIKFFDNVVFERITGYSDGIFKVIVSENENTCSYLLDDSFEELSVINAEINNVLPYESVSSDFSCPYALERIQESEGIEYRVIDLLSSSYYTITSTDLISGESQEYYFTGDINVTENGKLFSTYTYLDEDEYGYTSFISYNGLFPELYGNPFRSSGTVFSIHENLVFSNMNPSFYSLYDQNGEKLYDFDLPDEGKGYMWLGNKTGESGEKFFYADYETEKAFCYEYETGIKTELKALNENFENEEIFVTGNKYSEKYDIIAYDSKCIYGYNAQTDELTLICDCLDTFGMNFSWFVVSDDNEVYCTAEGSNTLYRIVSDK